ncbi:MAG: hypothetical protein JRH20_07200 [Deltaproteobacteria bacterium]|nr:hypothetical protein [Deltaproteobacteria bacterium]
MLDPWIIEEIRRREERHRKEERPYLELPLAPPEDEDNQITREEDERGVAIIDYRV